MSHYVLQPSHIQGMKLRNRAVVAPMTRVSTKGDGVPTQAMADYYTRYAEGGFAMVITEGAYTDRHYAQAYPNQPGITNQKQMEGWQKIVEGVHRHEGKIILQLMHAGALSQHLSHTRAPSRMEPMRNMLPGYSRKQGRYPVPEMMNLAEIDQVIDGFVAAAKYAEIAGFDGVEIHSANGYLLDQFITEYTNQREDHYGGSVENRSRLTAEIVTAIAAETRDDFIVGVRLSQGKVNDFDYMWPGGANDGGIIFPLLQKAGADYIHFASEGQGFDHGCLTRDGESLPQLAKSLTGLPVIANGGLHKEAEADRILTGEHADFVALGTGALVNPDWPKRLASEREVRDFTFDLFAGGVDVEAQFRYEKNHAI